VEREFGRSIACCRKLLATHRGQLLQYMRRQVVVSDDDKLVLALRVLAKVGNLRFMSGASPPSSNPSHAREFAASCAVLEIE